MILSAQIYLFGRASGQSGVDSQSHRGVYVAGGAAPKIIAKLKDGTFMRASHGKEERMQPLHSAMLVRVIINTKEHLINPGFVIPAEAGIQYIQSTGHRPPPVRQLNQRFPNVGLLGSAIAAARF